MALLRRLLVALLALLFSYLGAQAQSTWQSGDLPCNGVTNNSFHYEYLLLGYNATGPPAKLFIYEHANDMGDCAYQGGCSTPLHTSLGVDGWWNNAAWQNRYGPIIIVLPYADQTSDPSGQTSNFGGYGDTPGSQPNEVCVAALTNSFIANYNVDKNKIDISGESLGGLGSTAAYFDYNYLTGSVGHIFTTAMPLSGATNRTGAPNATQVAQLQNGPLLFSINGTGDNQSSNPVNWTRPLWNLINNTPNNTTFPGYPGAKAGSTNWWYLEDPALYHDTWDTYAPLNGTSQPLWDNFFAQTQGQATGGTGSFSIANGQIIAPNGKVFQPRGVNIGLTDLPYAITNSACQPLTTQFPNINIVRLGDEQYQPTSTYAPWIAKLTACGIVTLMEEHYNNASSCNDCGGAGGTIYTTGNGYLQPESAWYAAMAAANAANTYVWYGTNNEPSAVDTVGGAVDLPGLAAWQHATYAAVRGTGATNIVLAEASEGAGIPGTIGSCCGYPTNTWSAATNVGWDLHVYGWTCNQSNDVATEAGCMQGSVAAGSGILATQSIGSSQGAMPVVIGEYGPDCCGSTGIEAVVTAVDNATNISGAIAWHWGLPGGSLNNDNLETSATPPFTLSSPFGTDVAAYIAAGTGPGGGGGGSESIALNAIGTQSQNQVFTVSGTIANAKVAPTLQYQDNGGTWSALPAGATVTATAFSFSNPAESARTGATVGVRDANNTVASAVSPPFTVAGSESPNDTDIKTVGPTITDSIGEVYAITAGAQVSVNGTAQAGTANVVEIAYVSHVFWQKNASGNWYSESTAAGPYAGPFTTSPLPVSPESFTFNAIAAQTSGVAFTVSGTIANDSAPPTLQYQINGGAWQALPGTTGTRLWTNQPGGQNSPWNIPIGAGATWGNAADPDTVAISECVNGSTISAGPCGIINSTANYGTVQYVGQSTDPTFSFSSTNNGRTAAFQPGLIDTGPTLTVTAHLPAGAVSPGPYPADNAITFEDATLPYRQYTFGGIGIQPPGLVAGQGPFSGSQGEWDDASSDLYGDDADSGLSGYNVGPGMIVACDVTPACNPTFPHIQHALEYATDAHLLKTNDTGDGYTLKPTSWPQRFQDGQSGVNIYTGNLLAGTTLGIPMSTAQPGGLDANCAGAFWTMQHYPLFFRNQAGGGLHLAVDQVADTSAYIASLRSCLPQLVALLRPMRNQHQTGQSFTTNPANGPGARLDTGPAPLAGSGGGSVTATTFSFVVPGQPVSNGDTIGIRDANATGITATSNSFVVASNVVTETLAVNGIANQLANAGFSVSGTISGLTAVPTLQYEDNSGAWTALPAGAVVSNTTFSFPHPGLPATAGEVVSVRDQANPTASAASNSFAVTAAPVESLTVSNIPSPQTVGVAFSVSGVIANAAAAPALQYEDNGGTWQALPAGSSVTASAYSFLHPGIAAAGNDTTAVRDSAATTVSATSNAYVTKLAESANNTVVTSVGPSVVDATGEVFTITAAGQVAVNGTADTSTNSVVALAYVSHEVWQENASHLWSGKTISTASWLPAGGTLTSPLPAESLTVNTIAGQSVGVAFNASGTIGSALTVPSLQYSLSGGPYQALPTGSTVTLTGWSFVVPAIGTAGTDTISVRDAGTTTISATSNSFGVTVPAAEAFTMQTISNQAVGLAFTVSGTIANDANPPILQYSDNGGAWSALPTGAAVSATGYSFLHPGLPAAQSMAVSLRDANNNSISVASNAFVVVARESANLTVITTIGPQIVDRSGNSYALTAGKQVAINGTADSTTSSVIEIAYVNRTVWFESANLDWWSRSTVSSWLPTGGTLLGPLPSSSVAIYLTNTRPLAVVQGYSLAVPGIMVNDTVNTGNFLLSVTSTDGVISMPGAIGTGTTAMTEVSSLSAINASLAGMLYTGRTVGKGVVTITVTDPAAVSATQRVNISVVRAAATLPAGRAVPALPAVQ